MREDLVLLIDDEVAFLIGLSRTFHGSFNIVTAESGEDALDLVERGHRFSVVLCDNRLKGMDGIATLTAFREKSVTTALILLSGFVDIDILRASINSAGAFRVLEKPCSRTTLEQAITDALTANKSLNALHRGVEQSVLGCIKMIAAVQTAFGIVPGPNRAAVMKLGREVASETGKSPVWEIDAALLLEGMGKLEALAAAANPPSNT